MMGMQRIEQQSDRDEEDGATGQWGCRGWSNSMMGMQRMEQQGDRNEEDGAPG